MCGRYVLTDLENFLQRQAWIKRPAAGTLAAGASGGRYNIAPTQDVVGVVRDNDEPGGGVLKPFHWGLVPSWAKDESVGNRMINARAETLLHKPAFERALATRRCVIPADGFYEWKKADTKRGGKQPFVFRLTDDQPFAFAGLWEAWRDSRDEERPPVYSMTIITGRPNALVAPVHDRMPVILPEAAYHDWLDVEQTDAEAAAALLGPYPAEEMHAHPVDQRVGNVGNDDAALLAREPDAGADEVAGERLF